MRAHELMSSIQYDGKAMLMDSDGFKVEVLITKDLVNEALQLQPGTYDLIPKTKAINNEKAFLKVKGSKFKYSNLIYNELELLLWLISQHFRVQKPPRYIEPLLHMAVVMALCVAEKRQVRCDYAKFILENLIEANLKNSAKNKLYMSAGPMLTRIAYQALGMNEDLLATASSRPTRSTRKSSSDEERTDTDKDQDSDESDHEDSPKGAKAKGLSEHEKSDEEDTSTPLDKKSKKLRTTDQVLMDEAMARVEARRKEMADARAAKFAKATKPMSMEEARKIRKGMAEKKRLEAERKAQEEAATAQAAQVKEKELAREKIKEALNRKAEGPILELSQGSPKRPRQEDEEELEHIQEDPPPSSPIVPLAPPSSPITPFSPPSSPKTPPSPRTLDPSSSPPAHTSPPQQQQSARPYEVQPFPLKEDKQDEQVLDKAEIEEKPKHATKRTRMPVIQLEEATQEEAYEEVRNFDYTQIILTLSRQFQCQQVVAKETKVQKERADKACEEIDNLRTALQLVTKERDDGAKQIENLQWDLLDVHKQLDRKEAQCHELIKTE
ncbi:hypothetical protein L7F22_037814 [Adiantum nelumboides]|nr:hypothetical protein [Adiantum nelumboides]